MHRQGYSNRAAARSAVRNATVRRSLARGRVPDGAPKNALHESVGRFFVALFQEGTIWCSVGNTRTGRRHAVL